MIKNNDPSIKRLLGLFIFLFGGIGSVIFFGCWLLDRCAFNVNSSILEMGICLEQSKYELTYEIGSDEDRFYLCGRIEGSTPRPGVVYVFHQDSVLYSEDFEHNPGVFFQQIRKKHLIPDTPYRIEVRYARKIIGQTEFVLRP